MMRKCLLYLSCLTLFWGSMSQLHPVQAEQNNWTEEKVGKFAIKADKAAMRRKWRLAIKYGEEMLKGSTALYAPGDPTYIYRLKNLNKYYDKAGRLSEVADRVKLAYELSKTHIEPSQNIAITCRALYYKLLLSQKKYEEAIPVIHLNISSLTNTKEAQFRKLHYFEQLYALYALTGQFEKEENSLLSYIELHLKIIGELDKDNETILKRLAQNYCRRKLTEQFEQLTVKYNLNYICS